MKNKLILAGLVIISLIVVTFINLPGERNTMAKPAPVADKQRMHEPVKPLMEQEQSTRQPPLRVEPRSQYVLDVVLHSAAEIDELLDKAEKLANKPRSSNESASIAMVLHGPEIDIFSIKNYKKYQDIVDRAAKLDAYNIIEVKMCMTMMRTRGMRNEDVPGFIELVPYGPEEIKKLQQQGYVKL